MIAFVSLVALFPNIFSIICLFPQLGISWIYLFTKDFIQFLRVFPSYFVFLWINSKCKTQFQEVKNNRKQPSDVTLNISSHMMKHILARTLRSRLFGEFRVATLASLAAARRDGSVHE